MHLEAGGGGGRGEGWECKGGAPVCNLSIITYYILLLHIYLYIIQSSEDVRGQYNLPDSNHDLLHDSMIKRHIL